MIAETRKFSFPFYLRDLAHTVCTRLAEQLCKLYQKIPTVAIPLRVSVCMQDLAHTVRTRLAEQPRFEAPKRPPHGFSVDHYAGKVTYSTLLLMDKNKDFVIAEHAALLKASGFQFAR